MALLGAAFTYLAHVMEGTRDLATPVFAISGTLVALILPAASLSAHYVEPRLDYWTERLANQEADQAAIQGRGRDALSSMEGVVAPLWRGFVFALVSFPLSAAALFRPNVDVYSVSAEELLVGTSMGFVIVAVFSFLPFIWEILQLDLARETRARLFAADKEAKAVSGSGTTAPRGPGAVPAGGMHSRGRRPRRKARRSA